MSSSPRSLRAGLGAVMLVTAFALLSLPVPLGDRAEAAVTPQLGYRATVDGFTSWYGSYGMGSLGSAWCIDHGIPAPDAALGYVPTSPAASAETRTGIAWLLGRHGYTTDRVTSAALMLALHDLMGAVYPGGRLDVHSLGDDRLAGFGGAEAAVLERARQLETEARARAGLRGRFRLEVTAERVAAGRQGTLQISVVDAGGRPVPDAGVLVSAEQPSLHAFEETDAQGRASVAFVATAGTNAFSVTAVAPDLELAAFAPTRSRAQRIVVPRQQRLDASTGFESPTPPSTTTTTTSTTTSTTSTTTTSTTLPPTTSTTLPPTTSTTLPPARGRLVVDKIDALSGVPLAEARFELRRPAPDQGMVAAFETTTEPSVVADLVPGRYLLVEHEPPPGYELNDSGAEIEVEIGPGDDVRLAVTNEPTGVEATEPPPAIDAPPPESTSTTTSTTSTTTTTSPPPVEAESPPPVLARTGSATVSTTLIGAGLLLLGAALVISADVIGPDGRLRPPRWRSRRRRRPTRARSSGGASRTPPPNHSPSSDHR